MSNTHSIPSGSIERGGDHICTGTFGRIRKAPDGAVKSFYGDDWKAWIYAAHEMMIMATLSQLPEVNRQYLLLPKMISLKERRILFPLGDCDLSQYKGEITPLLMFQMLLAVRSLHCANIAHLDLKPENFIMFGDRPLLGDFSLSRTQVVGNSIDGNIGPILWIAPEVYVGLKYGKAVDIWALGVTFYEILMGTNLFPFQFNGNNNLFIIATICGGFSKEEWPEAAFHHPELSHIRGIGIDVDDPTANAMLKRMLTPNPLLRPTIDEILLDPYFSSCHVSPLPVITLGPPETYPSPIIDQDLRKEVLDVLWDKSPNKDEIFLAIYLFDSYLSKRSRETNPKLIASTCHELACYVVLHRWNYPIPVPNDIYGQEDICSSLFLKLHPRLPSDMVATIPLIHRARFESELYKAIVSGKIYGVPLDHSIEFLKPDFSIDEMILP